MDNLMEKIQDLLFHVDSFYSFYESVEIVSIDHYSDEPTMITISISSKITNDILEHHTFPLFFVDLNYDQMAIAWERWQRTETRNNEEWKRKNRIDAYRTFFGEII